MRLYSAEILEHSRQPCGAGVMADATHELLQHNPICGDRVRWQLKYDSQGLKMHHQSKGCALCKASASILYEHLNGLDAVQMNEQIQQFRQDLEEILQGETLPEEHPARLFMGLSSAPSRKSCVWLPWDTLSQLLLQIH
jgi:nitrogen fixation NifU-like protein